LRHLPSFKNAFSSFHLSIAHSIPPHNMSADLSQLSHLLLSNVPYESLLATLQQPDTVAPHLLSPKSSIHSSPDVSPELLLSLAFSRPGRKRKDAPPVDPIIAAQSRTLRNRFAAQRSRERKRMRQEQLEVRNQELEEQNVRLVERLDGMQERIRVLQATLDKLVGKTNQPTEWQTRTVMGIGTPAVRVRHTLANTPTIAASIWRNRRGNAPRPVTVLAPVSGTGHVGTGLNGWRVGHVNTVCSLLRNPVIIRIKATRSSRKSATLPW
jgi:hypothetical protein